MQKNINEKILCPKCSAPLGSKRNTPILIGIPIVCPICSYDITRYFTPADSSSPSSSLASVSGNYLPYKSTSLGQASFGSGNFSVDRWWKIGLVTAGIGGTIKGCGAILRAFHVEPSGIFEPIGELVSFILKNFVAPFAYVVLAIAIIFFGIKLLYSVPLRASWIHLDIFSKSWLARISPVVVPAVAFGINFLSKWGTGGKLTIESVYNFKIHAAYVASVIMIVFHILVAIRKPSNYEDQPYIRPISRIISLILALFSTIIKLCLLIPLLWAPFSHAPERWFQQLLLSLKSSLFP